MYRITSTLVALGIVALVAVRRPAHAGIWGMGGLAAAYVVLARPMDALVVAGPLLVLGLVDDGAGLRLDEDLLGRRVGALGAGGDLGGGLHD